MKLYLVTMEKDGTFRHTQAQPLTIGENISGKLANALGVMILPEADMEQITRQQRREHRHRLAVITNFCRKLPDPLCFEVQKIAMKNPVFMDGQQMIIETPDGVRVAIYQHGGYAISKNGEKSAIVCNAGVPAVSLSEAVDMVSAGKHYDYEKGKWA